MKKRCVIITAFSDCDISDIYDRRDGDYIVCADGGIVFAQKSGIVPDCVLGDLDSVDEVGKEYNFERFPKEKDDTDTMLCLKHGLSKGYSDFLIVGGVGGRLDHTVANLQTLAYAKEHGAEAELRSRDAVCRIIFGSESIEIEKKDGFYLSLFAYSDNCDGVSVSGTKYELDRGKLDNTFPLGVSNEFVDEKAKVSLEKGKLLIILAR